MAISIENPSAEQRRRAKSMIPRKRWISVMSSWRSFVWMEQRWIWKKVHVQRLETREVNKRKSQKLCFCSFLYSFSSGVSSLSLSLQKWERKKQKKKILCFAGKGRWTERRPTTNRSVLISKFTKQSLSELV